MATSGPMPVEPTACFQPPQNPRKVVIDPDGDLYLQVGQTKCIHGSDYKQEGDAASRQSPTDGSTKENQQTGKLEHDVAVIFLVCSRAMSRASPVWKKLLYGGFVESKRPCESRSNEWLVELPEDNTEAMSTLLSIVHSRFENLPRTSDPISLEELYQLTVLTDKYDLTTALRPWATTWMRSVHNSHDLQRKKDPTPILSDLELRSWIAWEMGDLVLLEKVTKDMLLYVSVNSEGDLVNNSGDKVATLFANTLAVPGLYDVISEGRLEAIVELLRPFRRTIDCMLKEPKTEGHQYTCNVIDYTDEKERDACSVSILGAMIRSLSCRGLWPIPIADSFPKSVRALATELEFIDRASRLESHSDCEALPDIYEDINVVLKDPPFRLKRSHQKHLRNQAKKSGLAA